MGEHQQAKTVNKQIGRKDVIKKIKLVKALRVMAKSLSIEGGQEGSQSERAFISVKNFPCFGTASAKAFW